jgi:acylphosphatase
MYADKMKMKGYVRNLKDGRLEVWIEGGPDEVLFEMIRLLKKGPEGADVIKADIKWEKKKRYDNFSIAR